MRAVVKSVHLINYENWSYSPEVIDCFYLAAEALIGTAESDGSDIFSFEICTPKWYSENVLGAGQFVRHVLFVPEYDEGNIKRIVTELVEKTTGSDWTEIAEKLSRYFFWEFEDYQSCFSGDRPL